MLNLHFSRKALQQQNFAAAREPQQPSKFDSSLKKNLGFIKKIRTACSSEAINESIVNDIRTLTLEKYLSEIIPAFFDRLVSLTKPDDISAAIVILSCFFQRFQAAFTAPILSLLVNCIFLDSHSARERTTCVLVVLELNLVAIASRFSDCDPGYLLDQAVRVVTKFLDHNVTIVLLRTLMGSQDEPVGLPIIAAFTRRFEDELRTDVQPPTEGPTQALEHLCPLEPLESLEPLHPLEPLESLEPVHPPESAEPLCSLKPLRPLESREPRRPLAPATLFSLDQPPDQVLTHIQQLLTHIHQLLERYCIKNLEEYEQLRRKERKERRSAENTAIKYGKDFDNEFLDGLAQTVAFRKLYLQPMCILLGLDFPEEKAATAPVHQDLGFVWWSSDEERAFYENIPNLANLLEAKNIHSKVQAKLSDLEKVQAFLDFLASASKEAHIEQATVILHTQVPNNKATHSRILRFLIDSAKTDSLNLFAKFIKINLQYFDSILLELITQIDKGFRTQMYTGKINYRNVVFFSEMVKFKLVPSHLIFHKLRNMTVNLFVSNNIELLILFYERLGKFLLYEPEYLENTYKMLDMLRGKSRAASLSQYEKLYLNNLFLNIDSFTGKAHVQEHAILTRSDAQDFFFQLYREVLNAKTYPRVAKLLELVDFSKSSSAALAFVQVFRTTENLRLDSYQLAAQTMLHLPDKSRFVVHMLVHMLMEQLVDGLEDNDYRKSVARMSVVRFLGAMCNAGVLPFRSISEVLFKIVCHGYRNHFPTPDQSLANDARDNYFRVQLCCTLLKTVHFERARQLPLLFSDIKSLEGFLYFFQYFCYCKQQPFPRDIDFSLLDVLVKAHDIGLTVEWPENTTAALRRLQEFVKGKAEKEGTMEERREDPEKRVFAEGGHEEGDVDDGNLDDGCSYVRDVDDKDVEDFDERGFDDKDVGDLDERDFDDKDLGEKDFEEREDLQILYRLNYSGFDESDTDEDSDSESNDNDQPSDTDSDFSDSDSEQETRSDSESDGELEQFHRLTQDFALRQFDESMLHMIKESATSRSQTPLKMPDPSTYSVQEAPSASGPSFRFLSRSSQAKDLHLPSNSRFVSNFSNKQAQEKINREKISNLIINMYQPESNS